MMRPNKSTWPGVVLLAALLTMSAEPGRTQPSSTTISGELVPLAPKAHPLDLEAGDSVIGTLELKSGGGYFVVANDRGRAVEKFSLSSAGRRQVGFLAQTTGRYHLRFISRGQENVSYSLQFRTRKPRAAADVRITPVLRYSSPRLKQLAADLERDQTDALTRFWQQVEAANGSLVEAIEKDDEHLLVTFVWRQAFETHNVKLIRPPESSGSMDYYLSHLPRSDVWYKTMKVHRTSRFDYWFAPNYVPDEDSSYAPYAVSDPLNKNIFPPDIDRADWSPSSVLVLPGAPDDAWASRIPSRRGTVAAQTFNSVLLKAALNLWIYTPSGYTADGGPYPLAVVFDGPAYTSDVVAAPTIIDNLAAAGKIRPPIVCFVSSETSAANRAGNLQLNQTFAAAIATELLPWLRSSLAISDNPADRIVGGFSAGANAGFFIGLRHPEAFGSVLSQDGGGGVGRRLPEMFLEAPKVPSHVYMVHSLYSLPDLPIDELASMRDSLGSPTRIRDILRAKGSDVQYREVGATHGWLFVRTTFADALMALLELPR